ncbi:MAG TPA: winged helix-turn-helix transcriptional regulator [Candidatus Coprocola pullicola]|nr:winged helix-turn-helix transcriptional regulator [Candidatus Coprocola pullicola]
MNFEQKQELREFNCLYKEIEKLYHDIAIKAGMSDSSFFILYTIVELGNGCLQKDVSDMYSINKQTIHSSIRNLEKNGYIFLKKGKGRNMHIYLTEEGEKLIQQKMIPIMEAENDVFTAMTAQESKELLRLNKKYTALLHQKMSRFL